MGTTYSVSIAGARLAADRSSALEAEIAGVLERVDATMSSYDSASELSRFNAHRSTTPFPVSAHVARVFQIAHDVSERSGGAFDVTVAPLVDAWGFGPGHSRITSPDPVELRALAERVGFDRVAVDETGLALTKTHPETVADLSAIAKGYGVDLVAALLSERGLSDFLVEVGGELRASGFKADSVPWRVAIELPDPNTRRVFSTVELVNTAIATSGDYRNFYVEDGVRYSHIIDPRTGRPTRHVGASVSVLVPQAAEADAWATALTVLGPEKGLSVAEREGIAALFILRREDGFDAVPTSVFRKRYGGPLTHEPRGKDR